MRVLASSLVVALALPACTGASRGLDAPEAELGRGRLILTRGFRRERGPWPCGSRSLHMRLSSEAGEVIEIDYGPGSDWPESIAIDVPAGPLELRAHGYLCWDCTLPVESAREVDGRSCRATIDVPAGGESSVVLLDALRKRCRIELGTPEPAAGSRLEVLAPEHSSGMWYLEIEDTERWPSVRLRMPKQILAARFRYDDDTPPPRVTRFGGGVLQAWTVELEPGRTTRVGLAEGEPLDGADRDADGIPDLLDDCPDEPDDGTLTSYGCPWTSP